VTAQPNLTSNRTFADPTFRTAARNIRLDDYIAKHKPRLDAIEVFLIANPGGHGVRKIAKSVNLARLQAQAALDVLVELNRVMLVGGLYV